MQVLESSEIINAIFQDLKSFGKKRSFSKWLWKGFGFLLGKILLYPKTNLRAFYIPLYIYIYNGNTCSFY